MRGAPDPRPAAAAAAGEPTAITGLRLVVLTGRYQETVAFFRDGLGLPVHEPGGEATVFGAGAGTIEVASEPGATDSRLTLRLEADGVAGYGESLRAHGLRPLGPIELPWGERVCGVVAPGGVIVDLVERVAPPVPESGAETRSPSPPDLAVVACADAACRPLEVLGLAAGDAHLVTNAGGVVTEETVRDLVAARRALGVSRVVVMQHRPCPFMDPGPLPSPWAADPAGRLRASLSRLLLPPLSFGRGMVEGVLLADDVSLTGVAPH